MNVLERQLDRFVSSSLDAVLRVPRRTDQVCSGFIQIDGEGFTLGFDLEIPVGTPLRGHTPTPDLDALQCGRTAIDTITLMTRRCLTTLNPNSAVSGGSGFGSMISERSPI
jgi:hypothetical protein